ncbi:5-formyltetrahydrofolate cyclo-ligase [Bathymodiolus thermophilus thioautotrophic gill symbiont]|uniref:5-formyltetrahydrofolate cyclo-ligase n=1 Tax=Bathymodiolus thermophilus thioautotrophic gill symbiont TaxID=2360 RepID=A0A1J5TTD8_9GAMM|nr:5-formyltetrahydrofolate cyclo-ligase [Bathymodiolus thermophilus thioautotrophic gill symbiont]AYQ55962.1 5-formyltetrahydrofolate cyclo-ligase [Bathymodiolus thermophilus thioautotrophic gill symbiont]OIR24122.1 5-formyltetrahydrofolate cyclo-ligase [Bathymodiolus thermophilus thioautotrophic gill symbiont]CAB5498938.1 5-formyltetrahydrofolate cyclo-ligase (EC [Bathymodiolus thermophilus thioautotrophic gill symbiont]
MNALRQSLRNQRNALSTSEQAKFAERLLPQAQQISDFQNGQKIALYLANDGEINPKYIKNFLKNKGIKIYLPILDNKKLKFAKLGKKFTKNKFGINEPTATEILNAEQLDIIFMPLVGFDEQKNRLGMGGGFYDRTLAFKKHQKHTNPKLIGLAFDCQKIDKLAVETWDVPLNAIITPTTIYK